MRSSLLAALAAAAGIGAFAVPFDVTRGSDTLDLRESRQQRNNSTNVNTTRLMSMREAALRQVFGPGAGRPEGGYIKRDGWSVRQGQRRARKARNQARHRAACRKGGRK